MGTRYCSRSSWPKLGMAVCGNGLVGVVSGLPEHRGMYLSAEEQQRGDQFLPCCSRALTERLVVDL